MSENQATDEVMDFFKALANAERLKIVGLLALEPRTVEQAAAALHLPSPLVARHLARLSETGLIKTAGKTYKLDTKALEALSRRVLSQSRPRLTAEDFEGEAYTRKVLSDFLLPNGRLKSIPAQQKKMLVVLQHIAQAFEHDIQYTEKQVNELLSRYYADTASLRRYLVDNGLLERETAGGKYWRPE